MNFPISPRPKAKMTLGMILAGLTCLAPLATAQITVNRTVTVGTNIPDYTVNLPSLVSTITITNSGMSSITDVKASLVLSSPNSNNVMRVGQIYASLTHGTALEEERVAVLLNRPGVSSSNSFGSRLTSLDVTFSDAAANNIYGLTNSSGTYAPDGRLGVSPYTRTAYSTGDITAPLSDLAGSYLSSGSWSLLVADAQQGGQARLDRWGLEITGLAATNGIMDVGNGGRITISGSGLQNMGGAESTGTGTNGVALVSGANATLQMNDALKGGGDFNKEGAGAVRLTAASTNFTGTMRVTSGEVEVANSAALGSGQLEVASGAALRVAAGVNLNNAVDLTGTNKATLAGGTSSSDVSTVSGVISGSGGIEKTGAGRLVLTGTNTYEGATDISEGKLVVNGDISSSSKVTVEDGGTLGGSGTVGVLEIASGGTLAVGNSPGTLIAGNTTWAGGASLAWEVDDSTGNQAPGGTTVFGQGTSWDFLDVTGTLNITATSGSKFIIDVISLLNGTNTGGAADGFAPGTDYSFAIATASGGLQIGGFGLGQGSYTDLAAFNAALSSIFDINTGSFANNLGSDALWSISTSSGGTSLLLSYSGSATAIPEPSSAALALIGLGVLALNRRRCRR
jgi:autotransporter-associated beta strand protein